MVKTFAEALMSAEADAVCGGGDGERSDERTNQRPAPLSSPLRSCGRARISRTGCCSTSHLSKSQVSKMATHLDAHVEAFRNGPLDGGPSAFIALNALIG
ncbi:hypothetical protein ACFFTR_25490 [Dactylosporangium vinaceum]|uniref:Uncharacterized protein n=1 Tax=Dactylosporangium vinaceum TaxID=53362 RepID=A0ABV5MC96_9ACTN